MEKRFKYKAFICYSYRDAGLKKKTSIIEKALKQYAKPWYRFKPALQIFRDEYRVAPGMELRETIKQALEQSEYLIYMASGEAAQSQWVQTELRIWCEELKRPGKLIVVLLDGELHAGVDGIVWRRSTVLPPLLEKYIKNPVYEKLAWAKEEDMTFKNKRFLDVITKIKARLLGVPAEEMRKEYRRSKFKRRWAWGIAAFFLAAASVFSVNLMAKNQRHRTIRELTAKIEDGKKLLSKESLPALMTAADIYKYVTGNQIDELYPLASRFLCVSASSALDRPFCIKTTRLERKVKSAIVSPDGSKVLTIGDDYTARLSDLNGRPLAVFKNHGEEVIKAEFSPQGDRVVTVSREHAVMAWNVNGSLISTLHEHSGPVTSTVFSPNGLLILTASNGDTAKIWNPDSGKVITLRGHGNDVFSVCFSPDGTRVLTVSAGQVMHWDVKGNLIEQKSYANELFLAAAYCKNGPRVLTQFLKVRGISKRYTVHLRDMKGKKIAGFSGHDRIVFFAAISPDGDSILTADASGKAVLWDSTGRTICTLAGREKEITSAWFYGDVKRILTTSSDRSVQLWDFQGHMLADMRGHGGPVTSAMFFPGSGRAISVSKDNTVKVWELYRRPVAACIGHSGPVGSVRFSPDGSRLLTASLDNTAMLWDIRGEPVSKFTGHTGSINGAEFSPDGRLILTASADHTVKLWNHDGGLNVELVHSAPLNMAEFSSNGEYILTLCVDKTLRLWDLSGKLLKSYDNILLAGFSPDSREVVTVPDDFTVRFRDLEGGLVRRWDKHNSYPNSIVFSRDGASILTACGAASVWRKNGELVIECRGKGTEIYSGQFSNDGRRILTVPSDQPPKLWGIDGNMITAFKGHKAPVKRAVFSPDNTRVATASEDNTVKLWDLDGNILGDFDKHKGPVNDVVFSPDGRFVATASDDGTAIIWYTPEAVMEWLKTARLPKQELFKK